MKSRQYGLKQILKQGNSYSELAGLPKIETSEAQIRKFNMNFVAWDQQNRRQAANNTAGQEAKN